MKLSASSLSIALLLASRFAVAAEDPTLTAAELFGPPEPDRVVEEPKPKAPSAVTWQIESGAASTYVWRGRPQYASRNDPSMQSSANMTWSGLGPGALTLGGWNAMALDHAGNQPGTASRVDLSIGYGWALNRRLKARVGYTAILFPHAKTNQTVDRAHELVSMLTYDGVVTPFVAVYPEVVRMLGVYAITGVSKTIELPDGYSLTPSSPRRATRGAPCTSRTSTQRWSRRGRLRTAFT